MTTASDISHPAYLAGKFGRSYIIFGVVTYFVYCNYDTTKGYNDWDGVVKNQKRLEVRRSDVPGNRKSDWDISAPPNN